MVWEQVEVRDNCPRVGIWITGISHNFIPVLSFTSFQFAKNSLRKTLGLQTENTSSLSEIPASEPQC